MTSSNIQPVNWANNFSRLVKWLKTNLFSTWYNYVLTALSLSLIYWVVSNLGAWAFNQAEWQVLEANLRLFFVGRYPVKSLWRTWVTLGVLVSFGGLAWGMVAHQAAQLFNRRTLVILGALGLTCGLVTVPAGPISGLLLAVMLLLLVLFAWLGRLVGRRLPNLVGWLPVLALAVWGFNIWFLLSGNNVRLDRISGLMLTLPVALTSIVLCFPLGVLLALGRQSKLPIIRGLSIAYIELVRGVPLITIIFMAQVMLPLVLPPGMRVERIIRAIAGFTLYSAAYLAENVRGGLQAIPPGQKEAAQALGLNSLYTLWFIILPQALKAVIPSMVGQFIALFKDTSLLAIVGLTDLLGMSQSIIANPKYLGRYGEVYLFVATIYFVCCYAMSWASKKLEN